MRAGMVAVLLLVSAVAQAGDVWLSQLDLGPVRQGWGVPQRDRAVTSNAFAVAGTAYTNGIGSHAPVLLSVELDGNAKRFRAACGVDDHAGSERASIRFLVVGDGKVLWKSDVARWKQPAAAIDVDLAGVKSLLLVATDAGDGKDFDHADWLDARIETDGAAPRFVAKVDEKAEILTPPPAAAPRINGPKVYGSRPGHPFLYRIPCTGERPVTFAAAGLPAGLTLDAASGIIRGAIADPAPRTYRATLTARNAKGAAEREFRIVAGDRLSLTPQMGYNHWYAHYNRITQKMMEEAADLLVSSGMADAGYQYVNIDDCWMKHQGDEPYRDADGAVLPNKLFPDMKGLADYIHAKGLKAGLYTSPGPWTCAGFAGAYQHEAADARRFAAWGYDFLKYDWCSYGNVAGGKDLAALQKPYRLMGDLLKQQDRDIVLNLCQYGMGDVWKWGAEVGGHSWRTGGDLGFELHRIFEIAKRNCELRDYNQPGGYNDPDYLQIGWIGNASGMGLPQPAPLTPNESHAFMALWCLMASPLFYSGDMTKLDAFTLSILCNPELIEINQDALGQCARLAKAGEDSFVLVKDLEDGTKAVGLCNTALWAQDVAVAWPEAGVGGRQVVRDCWRQKDLGTFHASFRASVPPRMVLVLRLRPAE